MLSLIKNLIVARFVKIFVPHQVSIPLKNHNKIKTFIFLSQKIIFFVSPFNYLSLNFLRRLSLFPFTFTKISRKKERKKKSQKISFPQINSNQHSVTDYARPNNGVSHYQISEETVVETQRGHPQQRDQLDLMLGNLQADMSRQGVNTQQKGCCSSCDKPIVGQVITGERGFLTVFWDLKNY